MCVFVCLCVGLCVCVFVCVCELGSRRYIYVDKGVFALIFFAQ